MWCGVVNCGVSEYSVVWLSVVRCFGGGLWVEVMNANMNSQMLNNL